MHCSDKYLFCRAHWHMVPEALQRLIWRLWNNGKPKPGHLEACNSAVEIVLEKMTGP